MKLSGYETVELRRNGPSGAARAGAGAIMPEGG